jgi:Flp pilus assembly protein TadD
MYCMPTSMNAARPSLRCARYFAACALLLACAEVAPVAREPVPLPAGTATPASPHDRELAAYGGSASVSTVAAAPGSATAAAPVAAPAAVRARAKSDYPAPRVVALPLVMDSADPLARDLAAADALADAGKYREATTKFNELARRAPKAVGPKLGLLRVRLAPLGAGFEYGALKGQRAALEILRDTGKVVADAPDYAPAHIELARAALLTGDAEKARAELLLVESDYRENAEYHSALAVSEIGRGNVRGAIVPARRAVALDEGSASRHGNLATILLLSGSVDDAIVEYDVQVLLAENSAQAHSDLGTAWLAAARADRALPSLRRAIVLDSSRASYHSNLGYAQTLLGDTAAARIALDRAIALDPKLVSAWLNLGVLLAKQPSTRAEARAALNKAKALAPSDPRVTANLEDLDELENSGRAPGP